MKGSSAKSFFRSPSSFDVPSADELARALPAAKSKPKSWYRGLPTRVRERLKQAFVGRVANTVYTQESAQRLAALADSAEYARQHMRDAVASTDIDEVIACGVEHAPRAGLFAEFGVWQGTTINSIADQVGSQIVVHGFDSFQGLPEAWDEFDQGSFHTHGKLPKVRPNVRLHVGWFEDTVPRFAEEHAGQSVAFLHVDCDLYSSTKTIFDHLGERLTAGSVIVFDEYFNYPGWREHEYRAFQELVQARSLRYRYLMYNTHSLNVAVQIVG